MVVEQNNIISQNYLSFTETAKMGTENMLWKFVLDQIIFLDFAGIGSLQYKEIRVSGAKRFWWVYNCLYALCTKCTCLYCFKEVYSSSEE